MWFKNAGLVYSGNYIPETPSTPSCSGSCKNSPDSYSSGGHPHTPCIHSPPRFLGIIPLAECYVPYSRIRLTVLSRWLTYRHLPRLPEQSLLSSLTCPQGPQWCQMNRCGHSTQVIMSQALLLLGTAQSSLKSWGGSWPRYRPLVRR